MLESFDGGQTLRQDNGEDDQPEDMQYRADQPVSINSSIEIISKNKGATSREVMNNYSNVVHANRSPPGIGDKLKKQSKQSKFMAARQNLNLNQITSLSQLKRIKVQVEENEEDC